MPAMARTLNATRIFRCSRLPSLATQKRLLADSFVPLSSQSMVFDNSKEVFGHRSTKELLRSYLVLHVCSFEPLVTRSFDLMKFGEKLIGPFFLSKLVSPFYFQFVAGNSEEQMKCVAKTLASVGINLMVAPTLETDLGEIDASGENLFEINFNKTLHLIELSSRCSLASNNLRPICQTKITAHINAELLAKISSFYEGLNVDDRYSLVRSISDYMKQQMVTNQVQSDKILDGLPLSVNEMKAFAGSLQRLMKIGETCKENNVILTVDAEYNYFNPGISLLTLALMRVFNDELPVIWNTYQGYLKGTPSWLKHDFGLVRSLGVSFGAKLVRGAYMEREREMSRRNHTPDPVNETYEITNQTYETLVDYLFPHVVSSPFQCQFIAATHNEKSVLNLVRRMEEYRVPNSTSSILFGQIYGMAENISVPLSKGNYSIYKSVPYGDIIDVLPYLSRRANENRAVFYGARKERALLSEELRRRLASNFLFTK